MGSSGINAGTFFFFFFFFFGHQMSASKWYLPWTSKLHTPLRITPSLPLPFHPSCSPLTTSKNCLCFVMLAHASWQMAGLKAFPPLHGLDFGLQFLHRWLLLSLLGLDLPPFSAQQCIQLLDRR